jgi:hypothetical protein
LLCLPASAYVVDNFDSNSKTGWTDTLNGGAVANASKVFSIGTAAAVNKFTYSIKTGGTYTNTLAANHTLEFRVKIIGNVNPSASTDVNGRVVLGFVPNGGALLTDGYAVAVGRRDFQIWKNGSVIWSADPKTNNSAFNINNSILTLRLTADGSASTVTINARVHKNTLSGAAGQYYQEAFEQTVVDSSSVVLAGNVGLGVTNTASATGASAVFDDLDFFDIQNISIDGFGGTQNDLLDTWTVISSDNLQTGGEQVTETGGQVQTASSYFGPNGGYAGCFFAQRPFVIDTNGGRLELNIDLVSADPDAATFPVLGFLPGGSSGASQIREYFVAPAGSGACYNGKQYGTFTGAQLPKTGFGSGSVVSQFPSATAAGRLTIILSAEPLESATPGSPASAPSYNCRVETRLEDLSYGINDSNRVVWAQVFVDSPNADAGASEIAGNQAPYIGPNNIGNYAVFVFNAGKAGVASATFDNATAGFTIQPPLPPVLKKVRPTASSSGDPAFLPAATTDVSFDAVDVNFGADILLTDLSVTLNGVTYNSASPGVSITPSTPHSPNRHFSLTGVFNDNVNYTGGVLANNAALLSSGASLSFDTFLTNVFGFEMEEYNYTTNYDNLTPIGPGGLFIDNYTNCSPSGQCYSDYAPGATYPRPETICEGCTDPYAYNGLQGAPEIDFHSNHGPHTGQDADHTFRYDDNVRTERSTDVRRGFYVHLGSGGEGGFNEEELEGLHDGDWQNYTKTVPSGYFKVFLRQSQFKLPVSQITLEQVTSDPTVMGQTTVPLGTFSGTPAGLGFNRNVPLTDGAGNPVILHFTGGVQTFKVVERITGNDSDNTGNVLQNYMIFTPVPNPGTLRPVLSYVSPPPNFTIANNSIDHKVSILNRDTSVDTSSIILQMNGTTVARTVTPTATGADVTYSLTVLPISPSITNTLIYSDGSVFQTNSWSYTINFLYSSNSLPVGALTNRGWDVRMVQIDVPTASDNSLLVAEAMLSLPPTIVPDPDLSSPPEQRLWQTNVQTLDWNDNTGNPKPVPGLDGGISGWAWPVAAPPASSYDNIATECLGYMNLKAGFHRFRVASDDSMEIRSGINLKDAGATRIASHDGTYYVPVDFMVQADGLYPARAVWQEEGGYAEFHIWQRDPDTAAERILNDDGGDQSDPNLVKVYYPSLVTLYSSSTANGIFTPDAAGVCDGNAQTVTVPISGGAKFYKLFGVGSSRVTKTVRSGNNIVISYKLYFQPGY